MMYPTQHIKVFKFGAADSGEYMTETIDKWMRENNYCCMDADVTTCDKHVFVVATYYEPTNVALCMGAPCCE